MMAHVPRRRRGKREPIKQTDSRACGERAGERVAIDQTHTQNWLRASRPAQTCGAYGTAIMFALVYACCAAARLGVNSYSFV